MFKRHDGLLVCSSNNDLLPFRFTVFNRVPSDFKPAVVDGEVGRTDRVPIGTQTILEIAQIGKCNPKSLDSS